MTNSDRARKMLARTALVTSTTIATLVGAQNFAMLDARAFQTSEAASTPVSPEVVVVPPVAANTPAAVERAAPTITILHAAPSITILRQSGQPVRVQPPAASVTSIQPPVPSQIAAPAPVVVVQQPVPQPSRSSR